MLEREFAERGIRYLHGAGWQVLRVCDFQDARRGKYGLFVVGAKPQIKSTGPDYLVVRASHIPAVKATSLEELRAYIGGSAPFFWEAKVRGKEKRKDREEQERWMRVVCGGTNRR